MRVSSRENCKTSFNAKLLSQWRCSNSKNGIKNISVVSIEKSDLDFMHNFLSHIENQSVNNNDKSSKEIMVYGTKTIIEILKSNIPSTDKIKMLVATYNNKACGILVANVPKIRNQTYTHSSRHNAAKNETEIDWLVTWNPTNNEKLKGIGKALVGEYFHTVKKDKFLKVFVRSEVPEKSFATYFYEKLGFETLNSKRLRLSNKNSAQCIVKDYGSESNDETVPMIITKKQLEKKANELAKEMNRQEFKENKLDAKDLINL